MADPRPDDLPPATHLVDDLGVEGPADTPEGKVSPQQPVDTLRDVFTGPRDKNYLDLIARRMTKIRGTYAFYYRLRSQTQRTDGRTPVTTKPGLTIFDQKAHAGGSRFPTIDEDAAGLAAAYGEPVLAGRRIDSVTREITPDWNFDSPFEVRGVIVDPERSEDPDERGSIYTKRLRFHLARVLCETEWSLEPQIGDMLRVPDLLNDYYDVEEVVRNTSRFGGTGFFTVFVLQLARSSRHTPERKIAEKDKRDQREPVV